MFWLTFPHQDGVEYNHSNTVLDGEFVIDVDPATGQVSPMGRGLEASTAGSLVLTDAFPCPCSISRDCSYSIFSCSTRRMSCLNRSRSDTG